MILSIFYIQVFIFLLALNLYHINIHHWCCIQWGFFRVFFLQFVITIRLFKLYYSFCFSTLLINRKLYCKMLHFEMRAEYKCYQIWSNSMKNHTYGIYIALVCCDNRSFCLRSFKDRGKFLENNSYRAYHRYKFQIACQYNLLPHIRQPD